jgi:predicted  nucleic acid-binding Zn-ribbon protein
MNAFNEGNDIVKDGGLAASATELLSPFFEPEMSFKMAMNVYNNENDFGSRIYNPMDESGDKALDVMEFIIKKAKPSTVDLIQRIYSKENKTNEISSIFGGRGYDVDIAKSFSFKLKAAEELFDANRDALNKLKYGQESTPEQIEEAERKFEERTNKVIKMLAEDYQAAIRLGTKIEKLDEVLDRKKFFQGYNKNVKNQIKSGVVEEESTSEEIKEWQP